MPFKYVKNYKSNDLLRKSFNKLAGDIFEIDFENWFSKGFWDETFICHSFVENGKVVSNVSVTKTEMLVNGESKKAIQIGTVMTDSNYRNMGLARQLMEKVIEEYEHTVDLIYLFPNESVMDFYPKFGFSLITDYQYSVDLHNINSANTVWRKIDVSQKNDLSLLLQLASHRAKRSTIFDIKNGTSVFMWHCLNTIPDSIYVNSAEDLVVVYEKNDDYINLFDIISIVPVMLRDLIGMITDKTSAKVKFHFTPDFEDFTISSMAKEENEPVFVKPIGILNDLQFSHPLVAHT